MKRLVALLAVLLCACTKTEKRYVAPWLRVDVIRPVTGNSGVIVSGATKEIFLARVDDRWIPLGDGHTSRYLIFGDENYSAVLFDLNDGRGLQLARPGAVPQPVAQLCARGDVVVPPGTDAVDVFACSDPDCRAATIDRCDFEGKLISKLAVSLPAEHSSCRLLSVKGYDHDSIPYAFGQCRSEPGQSRCVLVASRKDGPFAYAVGPDQPWDECNNFSRSGVSLAPPRTFELIR